MSKGKIKSQNSKFIYVLAFGFVFCVLSYLGARYFLHKQQTQKKLEEQQKVQTLNEILSQVKLPPPQDKNTKITTKKEGTYSVKTASTIKVDSPVTFSSQGESLAFTPLTSTVLGEVNDVGPKEENQKTVYQNVYNGVNLIYTRSEDTILEEYEIKFKKELTELIQKIDLSEVDYKKGTDGSIKFFKKDTNEFVYAIPKPVMYEKFNHQERSYGLHFKIVEKDGITYLIKLIDQAGQEWLKKANYPVMIDATVTTSNLNLESYPLTADNKWTVRLDTVGQENLNLAITPEATLESLTCDGQAVSQENFTCAGEALVTYALLTPSTYHLTTTFGGETKSISTVVEAIEDTKPVFISISQDPLSAAPGTTINLEAKLIDPNGIKSVKASMGEGLPTVDLKLDLGTDKEGTWTDTWVVEGAKTKTYYTTFTAINNNNVSFTSQSIEWMDPPDLLVGGDWGGADFIISSNSTVGGVHTNVGNFVVDSGITATVVAYNGTSGGKFEIQAVNVEILGIINADGKGYSAANGPGGGKNADAASGGGAGHGGIGGTSSSGVTGGPQYDSLANPSLLGSGGGNTRFSTGGRGGGVVRIITNGTTNISGVLTANGLVGSGDYGPGGGSGGSIYLSTSTLISTGNGNKTISAVGGGSYKSYNFTGGNGSGGRIAIYHTDNNSFEGTISVNKGTGGFGGEDGTAFIENLNTHDLTIPCNNGGSWYATDRESWSFRNLTINGNVKFKPEVIDGIPQLLTISSSGTTTIADNITITLGGAYNSNEVGNSKGVYLNLTGDVTIPANTTFSANGTGYPGGATGANGQGPGGGIGNKEWVASGGGGGYGGRGQTGSGAGGDSYGSFIQPTDLGSGAGGGSIQHNVVGGSGGGAIRISTTGTLEILGTLTANGAQGPHADYSSGGSGGSIFLTARSIEGNGTLSAKGANKRPAGGVGGGGGRIAIYYTGTNSFEGTIFVTKGTGGSGGEDGTIHTAEISAPSVNNLSQYQYDCTTEFEAGETLEGAPGNVTGCFKATLSDNDNPDSLFWELEVKEVGKDFTIPDKTSEILESIGSPITSSIFYSDLLLNTSYHWRARAVDKYGTKSAWISYPLTNTNDESEADFIVKLPAPTNVVAHYVSDSEFTLTWQDNATSEEAYLVERSVNDETFVLLTSLPADSTTFTDNSTTNPTDPPSSHKKYIYRVKTSILGSTSDPGVAAPAYTTPPNPSSASVSQTAVGTMVISWTDNSDYEEYFEIQRKIDSGEYTTISSTIPANSTSFPDYNVQEEAEYIYRVRAIRTAPDVLNSDYATTSALSPFGFGKGIYLSKSGRLFVQNNVNNEIDIWTKVQADFIDQIGEDLAYNETSPANGPVFANEPTINDLTVVEGGSKADGKSDVIYVGTDNGLVAIHENALNSTVGGVKYYSNTSISELMIGDIRGAWSLIDTSDASAKGNTLTNNGSVSFDASGVRGKAASFNGTHQYLSVSDNASLSPTSTLTYGGWFKTNSNSTEQSIISKNGSYTLKINSSGKLEAFVTGKTTATRTSATTVDTGWHQAIVVYNPTTLTLDLYLDGKIDNGDLTGTVPTALTDSDSGFNIGADNGSTFFNGSIDEVFVTATVLTAGHIKLVYYDGGNRALQNHIADSVTGISSSDSYQKISGGGTSAATVNKVNSVRVDDGNQFIYVGTHDATGNTGGVSVIGVNSDSLVDLYDANNNTTKADDNSKRFSVNDVVALAVVGIPNPAYGKETDLSNNGGAVMILGNNDTATRLWMENQTYALNQIVAGGGTNGNTKTFNDGLRVANILGSSTASELGIIQNPVLEVTREGKLTYNYQGLEIDSTAASFSDTTLTTGTLMSLSAGSLTTGKVLELSAGGLDSYALYSNSGLNFFSGNVGIGTTAPSEKLEVNGNIKINGSGIFDSLVGIGTTAPAYNLDLVGTLGVSSTAYFGSRVGIGTTAPTAALDVNGDVNINGMSVLNSLEVNDNIKIGGTSFFDNLVGIGTTAPAYNLDLAGTLGVSSTAYFGSRVGIGTTSPGYTLDVTGDGRFTTNLTIGGVLTVSGNTVLNGNTTLGDSSTDTLTVNSASWTFVNDTNFNLSGGVNGLSFDGSTFSVDATNDRIGIGTTSPSSKLEVLGEIRGTRFAFQDDTDTYLDTLDSDKLTLATNGENRLIIDASGNVGIGTDSPSSLLDVKSILNVLASGNVGIGTTQPTQKLDLNGGLKIFDSSTDRGDIYSTVPLDKTWTVNADFNAMRTTFSEGMDSPATNDELKVKGDPDNSPLPGWIYKKEITINNTNTEPLTDYQILITTDTQTLISEGKLQENCEDIRFTDTDGATLLNYWIEEGCNTPNTKIWVKIPSLIIGNYSIYMYYGNSEATNASSGIDTFDFFDGFDSFDSSKWTATGGYSVDSSQLTVTTGSVYTGSTAFSQPGTILETKMKWNNFTGSYSGLTISDANSIAGSNANKNKMVFIANDANKASVIAYAANGAATGYNIVSAAQQFTAATGTSYIIGHAISGSQVVLYKDRSVTHSYNGTWTASQYVFLGGFQGSTAGTSDVADVVYDWVLARKYTTSEATVSSVGSEIVAGYTSSEQTWLSDTVDAGDGSTLRPNKLTTSWVLDDSDNIAPKFQVLGSATGAFEGEETVYPTSREYYQDGGAYDINSAEELDISDQVNASYRYWKVKAYLDTGTTLTDTPKILDIRLKDYRPSLTLSGTGQRVGIGTDKPASRFEVVDYQPSLASATISSLNIGANTSVLALKVGSTAPETTNSFLTFLNGNGEIVGKVTGNGSGGVTYSTTGSDFAEYFKKADVNETLEPGDVVCLNALGLVTKCDSVNTQVVGVISSSAGFTGNSNHEGDPEYVLVGLLGQLEIKVSSESGEINPGDSLTSSSTAGIAQKATGAGNVIGKVLEIISEEKVRAYVHVSYEQVMADALLSSINATPLSSVDKDVKIEGDLIVSGKTNLADVSITGNLTAGVLTINGLEGSISSLNGILKLQNETVLIDRNGNINTQGEITAKKINIAGTSIGEAVLKAGTTQLTVAAAIVTDESQIFITPQTSTSIPLAVTLKTAGESFTIEVENAVTKDIKFSWWVVN